MPDTEGVEVLLQGYLDGSLDAPGCARLLALARQDEALARRIADDLRADALIREVLQQRAVEQVAMRTGGQAASVRRATESPLRLPRHRRWSKSAWLSATALAAGVVLLVMTTLVVGPHHAVERSPGSSLGMVLAGSGQLERDGTGMALAIGQPLRHGDRITAGRDLAVTVGASGFTLATGAVLGLGDAFDVSLEAGEAMVAVDHAAPADGQGVRLHLHTACADIRVTGTRFTVSVTPFETRLHLDEGRLELANAHGRLALAQGGTAVATAATAPARVVAPMDSPPSAPPVPVSSAHMQQSVEQVPLLDTFSSIPALSGQAEPIAILRLLPMTDRSSVIIRARCQAKQGTARERLMAHVSIKEWPDGQVLWDGAVPFLGIGKDGPSLVDISCRISGLDPKPWTPDKPTLYSVTLSVSEGGGTIAAKTERVGFRTMSKTDDGVFQLNGKPIYLRGFAYAQYAPPIANQDKKFALDYVSYLKSKHINAIRVTSQPMLEACDELGMMVFAGFYSSHIASLEEYRETTFPGLAPHPSVVIYIISNEVEPAGDDRKLLEERYAALKAWDPTRLYIGSCGFGTGIGGEIYSRHPYNGWYNDGNFVQRFEDKEYLSVDKPIVFTECVGAYTTEGGTFEIAGDSGKQMGAALRWAGQDLGNPEHVLWYQAHLAKSVAEWMRLGRGLYGKPNLAGTMPRTPMFYQGRDRKDIVSFDQMRPQPIAEAMGLAYQPLLLSLATYDRPHVNAGDAVTTDLWFVNDMDDASDVPAGEVGISIESMDGSDPTRLATGPSPALPYYAAKSTRMAFAIPAAMKTGFYRLAAHLSVNGREVARNYTEIFVARKEWTQPKPIPRREICLFDPSGATAAALAGLGMASTPWNPGKGMPPPEQLLVIGEKAWNEELNAKAQDLRSFVQAGGRVVLLLQDDPKRGDAHRLDWLPVTLKARQEGGGMLNPQIPSSPVLEGLTRRHLADLRAERSFPLVPFGALDHADVIINFRSGLVEAALVEVFDGKGTVLLSGLDLVGRAHDDPVAARLLANLVSYGASLEEHQHSPLITEPIVWGDFSTEKGIISPYNGLLLDVGTSHVDNLNLPLPVSYPVPDGRILYGPYSHDKMGKVVRDATIANGQAAFHVRVPSDRTMMMTDIYNPGKSAGEITFTVNGSVSSRHIIPPHKTVSCETGIPSGQEEKAIHIEGSVGLILKKSIFK